MSYPTVVARALAFVAEFKGDGRCALNCLYSEALAAEVHRQTAINADLLAALKRLLAQSGDPNATTGEFDTAAGLAYRAVAKAEGR